MLPVDVVPIAVEWDRVPAVPDASLGVIRKSLQNTWCTQFYPVLHDC
jgi:hypothetical protein